MKGTVRRVVQKFAILLIMAFTLCSTALAVSTNSKFTDVPQWCADSVSWAVEQSITNGTTATTFSPSATCTNAQVLTFLWRACGSPDAAMDNPFTDISPGAFYYKAALWAYQNNMVLGSRFEPNKPCTRSMAVTYMWQFAGQAPVLPSDQFADVSFDSDYAQAVAWAVDMGITNGTGSNQFSPDATCTRAQIIAFLYRGKILLNDFEDAGISEAADENEEVSESIDESDFQREHDVLEGILPESNTNLIEVISDD